MTQQLRTQAGLGGVESRAREPAIGLTTAGGPHQSGARSIVAPFEAVAYVYLRLAGAPSEEERDLRSRHAAEKLRGHGASETAAAVIGARIAAAPPAYRTLAVFVSQDGSVLHEQVLADADIADHAGCRSPAPVTPLLAWGQDRPAYVLVVTDRAGADITAGAGAGQPDQAWTVVGPDDAIERKRGPGGWSQPSYQRRVEDSWRHNAASVAQQVVTHAAAVDAQVLVLSGDVRAVQLLSERLPDDPALLVRHISGSRAADGSQAGRDSRVEQVLREAAAAQTARLLEELHERLAPGRTRRRGGRRHGRCVGPRTGRDVARPGHADRLPHGLVRSRTHECLPRPRGRRCVGRASPVRPVDRRRGALRCAVRRAGARHPAGHPRPTGRRDRRPVPLRDALIARAVKARRAVWLERGRDERR